MDQLGFILFFVPISRQYIFWISRKNSELADLRFRHLFREKVFDLFFKISWTDTQNMIKSRKFAMYIAQK